jgi:hypothetical protein
MAEKKTFTAEEIKKGLHHGTKGSQRTSTQCKLGRREPLSTKAVRVVKSSPGK